MAAALIFSRIRLFFTYASTQCFDLHLALSHFWGVIGMFQYIERFGLLISARWMILLLLFSQLSFPDIS